MTIVYHLLRFLRKIFRFLRKKFCFFAKSVIKY
nr:MAG TPA: hypothetical protein [Caudoviricetes sp.]